MRLTEQELGEIVAKVGRPRANNGGKVALDVERIRAMGAAGFSLRQIADYFGVGPSTVRRRLRERENHPVHFRPAGSVALLKPTSLLGTSIGGPPP